MSMCVFEAEFSQLPLHDKDLQCAETHSSLILSPLGQIFTLLDVELYNLKFYKQLLGS